MNLTNYISKKSYFPLGILFVLFLIVWIFWSFSWFLLLLIFIVLFVYRKSNRNLVCNDLKAVLAPIGGKVTKIDCVKYRNLGERIEINIKNAFYQIGVFSTCCKMDIKEVRIKHGLFLCSESDLAKQMNERILIFATAQGKEIVYRVYAGSLDRKLKLDNFSRKLQNGDEMGFLINGSISLLLPKDSRIYVALGDEIKSGSLLGYLS